MSSPAKLFSCVDATSILKSPTNRSTAKYHWTFSRNSRFKVNKKYCDKFYRIPGIKQNKNRMTSFGYGRKTDLDYGKNPQHVVPEPGTYIIPSFTEINKNYQKGFTQLFSREEVKPMSYIPLQPGKMPPPGKYNEYRYNQSPKWSLGARSSLELVAKPAPDFIPSPTSYNFTEAINKDGNYKLSNHTNSKSKVFNPRRSKRFSQSVIQNPGPGTYYPKNDMGNEGIFVLSKNMSAENGRFLEGRRSSLINKSITPGPGSYRAPSQFGQYDIINTSNCNQKQCKNLSRTRANSSPRGTPIKH